MLECVCEHTSNILFIYANNKSKHMCLHETLAIATINWKLAKGVFQRRCITVNIREVWKMAKNTPPKQLSRLPGGVFPAFSGFIHFHRRLYSSYMIMSKYSICD